MKNIGQLYGNRHMDRNIYKPINRSPKLAKREMNISVQNIDESGKTKSTNF